MNFTTKTEPLAASVSDTAMFRLPKRDIVDLMRSSASSAPLDHQVLFQDCLGEVETLLLLLQEFQANGLGRVETLSRHIQAGDSNDVADAARDLKVSADALSAKMLRDLAAALELSSGLVGRECQENLVAKLRAEMNRCLEHIPLVIASVRAEVRAT